MYVYFRLKTKKQYSNILEYFISYEENKAVG